MRITHNVGFTLIELLVVVLIIGILAAIALPQYQKAVERARTTDAITQIKNMEKAIELSVLQNGGIPTGNLLGRGVASLPDLSSDIELASGLTCTNSLGNCYNKDWEYYIACGGSSCSWGAVRRQKTSVPEGDISIAGGNFNGSTWYRNCLYYSDLGEDVCNMLGASLEIEDIEKDF